MIRIAVLDDWQRIAETCTDWDTLKQRCELTFFHEPLGSNREVVEKLRDFDGIMAMRERTAFPPDVVDQLPRLRFFNVTGSRARGLDDLVRRGVFVSTTGGSESGADTAEHTLALILAMARYIPHGDRTIRSGGFMGGVEPGMRLAGKTIGILGLGRIGTRVAGYAKALDMDVVAWSRSMTPARAADAGITAASRDELLASADVVSLNLVLSAETIGIVGKRELGLMRNGAMLVNTSRAALIDETALLAGLATGRLRAALDVFNDEPLPATHPLRLSPNTVLTPHVGYATIEAYQLFYRNSVENALAFLDGAPIRLYRPELLD